MSCTAWNRLAIIYGVGAFISLPGKDNVTSVLLLLGCVSCLAVRDILEAMRSKNGEKS